MAKRFLESLCVSNDTLAANEQIWSQYHPGIIALLSIDSIFLLVANSLFIHGTRMTNKTLTGIQRLKFWESLTGVVAGLVTPILVAMILRRDCTGYSTVQIILILLNTHHFYLAITAGYLRLILIKWPFYKFTRERINILIMIEVTLTIILTIIYHVLVQTSIDAEWKSFQLLANAILMSSFIIAGATVCCISSVILLKKNNHIQDVTLDRNKKALKRILTLNGIIIVLSIPPSVNTILAYESIQSKDYRLLIQHWISLNFAYTLGLPYTAYSSYSNIQ